MAQVSFEDAQEFEASRPQGNGSDGFDFFVLRNDGDKAVVRILYDSTSEFRIFTVHDIMIGGKRRKVSCIRNPKDATDLCPLCASGKSASNRFFIPMLQYVRGEDNSVIIKPVLWERSMVYASKLKSFIDEYGPLSDVILTITRNGAAGSMDTTYEIMFGNPKIYPDSVYTKDEQMIDKLMSEDILGSLILDKNFDELSQFVNTGEFPKPVNNNQSVSNTTNDYNNAPAYTPKEPMPVQELVNRSVPDRAVVHQAEPVAGPPRRTTRYY